MKLSQAISSIQEHVKDLSSDAYLAHAFLMDDGNKEWQIGYVEPEDESITVFVVTKDSVTKNPPAEALKKPGDEILPLKLEDVKVPADQALEIAQSYLKEHHEGHPLKQSIVLLQTLEEFGQVYNITLVTETFHMLNIKIASDSGEVVHTNFDHLMALKK